MKSWTDAAGICINEQKEILMVKSVGLEGWAVQQDGSNEEYKLYRYLLTM